MQVREMGMVFSSNEFLFFCLPISLILYFLVPFSYRNLILFIVSAVFYGWEKPIYLLVMLFVIAINYVFGHVIGLCGDNKERRKRILAWGIVINVLMLGFFKYIDFILENLSKIPFLSFLSPIGISLPIGISFYVFQSMSYIIDVYRGESVAQRNFVNFGAYVSMFPQLIAGPIVRYSDIDKQLSNRRYTFEASADGVRRFIIGLAKKVLLADVAGALWEYILDIPREHTSVSILWLGIIFYTFQIYFDFSGYSDMAIGLGKILGFDFPENFNYPYISRSITEFWRRWHITLSTWFKEYVYIPLGGNKRGKWRLAINLLVVWLLTGLWHGASWNFVVWGLYYFVLLIIEKFFLSKWLEGLPSIVSRMYALFFVVLGWLIFYFKPSVGGFGELKSYFLGMFGFSKLPFTNGEFEYTFIRNLMFLAILCIACTPLPKKLFLFVNKKLISESQKVVFNLAFDVVLVAIFMLCIVYITSNEYRPNIYFEF